MAALPGYLRWGDQFAGAISSSTFALNATTDQMEFGIQLKRGVVIDRLLYLPSAATGTATTWKISIQGVSTGTGGEIPDGTPKGGGSPASATFTNSAVTAGTPHTVTLANSYTPSTDERVFIVIAYDSGTAPSAGVNDLTISYAGNFLTGSGGFPYAITNDAGSRTRATTSHPNIAYSDGTSWYGFATKAGYSQNVNSGSSPAIYGQKFTVPAGASDTLQCVGMGLIIVPPAFTNDDAIIYSLYDGTSAIQTVTTQNRAYSTAAARTTEVWFNAASLSSLTAGSTYRLAIAPQSTSNWGVRGFTVESAAHLGGWTGGADWCASTLSGGVWTDLTTTRLLMWPIFSDMTEPAASGGGGPLIGGRLIRG